MEGKRETREKEVTETRGEMVKKEEQKELSQVRRDLVLSHQTVAYGCIYGVTRTLLLAISEQSSLIYVANRLST